MIPTDPPTSNPSKTAGQKKNKKNPIHSKKSKRQPTQKGGWWLVGRWVQSLQKNK